MGRTHRARLVLTATLALAALTGTGCLSLAGQARQTYFASRAVRVETDHTQLAALLLIDYTVAAAPADTDPLR